MRASGVGGAIEIDLSGNESACRTVETMPEKLGSQKAQKIGGIG